MTNIHIRIQDNPTITDFDPNVHTGLPTEGELGISQNKNIDNFGAQSKDPCNWFVFDPGLDGERPGYATIGSISTNLNKVLPGIPYAEFDRYRAAGTDSTLHSSGGPRNLGYAQIGDNTWYRLNKYIDEQGAYGEPLTDKTEVWKTGSIEFTIRPEKSNCTIVSGTSFPDPSGPFSLQFEAPGKQTYWRTVNGTLIELAKTDGPQANQAYNAGWMWMPGTTAPIVVPDPDAGLTLSSTSDYFRTFGVDIVDGFLRVRYVKHYGDSQYIELFGNTNIVDGNWHHVVINRPGPYNIKTGEKEYGGNGCLEIWVDGKLDNRTFEITASDALPAPQILFNNSISPGILNWRDYGYTQAKDLEWIQDSISAYGYVGGVRDYIYRQTTPLNQHYVSLNYVYSILNVEGGRIIKAPECNVTAELINPVVSSNKPKVLRLYWDNLLKDKESMIDGLEFDETYDVYSYSVTKKNLVNPSMTFNLDLNSNISERFFLPDVKTAIGRHVFIGGPGVQLVTSDLGSQIDAMNEARVAAQSIGDKLFLNNLLYGGVQLEENDLILLFDQPKKSNNGVWKFMGPRNPLVRPSNIDTNTLKNAHVYVKFGKYAGKTFIQTRDVKHIRNDSQEWYQVDNNVTIAAPDSYPIHYGSWSDMYGNQRFIDVNNDLNIDYDIIAFMNYPKESKNIIDALFVDNEVETMERYKEFINNIKIAVSGGKKLFVSSAMLAVDLGIVDKPVFVDQLLETSDAQAAAISPFESQESAANYYDTHRNNKYRVLNTLNGLTNKATYIMTDFVTYIPSNDYHVKYSNRPSGLNVGDEFLIPGLTTLPETANPNLPGYIYNQKKQDALVAFLPADINFGTAITGFSNNYYVGSTATQNPYKDYVTTIAANYGNGKIFVNCVENGYAFSRSDYNKGRIQNVTIGQNAETALTAAWQYSTKRLNKKDLYDFSDDANPIGQTVPTNGGGGGIIQSQSHASNGFIRKNTNVGDKQYESDLYPDFEEEFFNTTEIPVYSMTWLGLEWLKG